MPTRKLEKVVSLKDIKVACQECSLNEICLPVGMGHSDLDRLDSIIERKRPMLRGDHLFRAGEAFRNLYVVKTGAVKTFTQSNDGDEQVPDPDNGCWGRHVCVRGVIPVLRALAELPAEDLAWQGGDASDAEANRAFRALGLRRLFLHAASLRFDWPECQDGFQIQAALPTELQSVIETLRKDA